MGEGGADGEGGRGEEVALDGEVKRSAAWMFQVQ